MNAVQIFITVIAVIAIVAPIMVFFYTRKIAQVDKRKYQNWR